MNLLAKIHPVPPLLLTFLIGVFMYASPVLLTFAKLPLTYTNIAASTLMALGCIPLANSIFLFAQARTTVDPTQPNNSSSLVTHGIYRVTRNPMYVGFLLWLIGWGIYLENLIGMIGPIFFYWYINRFQIPYEEAALEKHFGMAYVKYCDATRRWL